MNDNEACAYVGKYMRKAGKPKPIRPRRELSPDQYYLYAFRNMCALPPMSGVKSYMWRVKFRATGFPAIQVIILLDEQQSCDAAVLATRQRFAAIDDLFIVVTPCERAFLRLCRSSR